MFSWCRLVGAKRFRYRMTVDVETEQGLVSGGAVREVTFTKRANGGDYARARGEAAALDLPDGLTLFALLRGAGGNVDHAGQDVAHLFRQLDAETIELWPNAPQVTSPRVAHAAPMLVTFTDIADPTSVVQVDPADLAAIASGVQLKRITVTKTSDPVTTGVAQRLAWFGAGLPRIPVSEHPPSGTPLPLFARLTNLDFLRDSV